jgi:hypothetical protein
MTIVTEICEILKRSVHLADFDQGCHAVDEPSDDGLSDRSLGAFG